MLKNIKDAYTGPALTFNVENIYLYMLELQL
jgi:hypothetical protein